MAMRKKGSFARRWVGNFAAVVAVACCACSARPDPPARVPEVPVVLARDGLGRLLRLARPARRIVSLSPSNTEIAFVIGCGSRLVLRDRASDYPPGAQFLPATDPFRLSVEHIAGFSPDLILASHLDASRAAALSHLGFQVAVFDPPTVGRMLDDVLAVAQLCGRSAAARRWVQRAHTRLRRLRERTPSRKRPRVYVELDSSDPLKPWTVGSMSLVHDVVRLAGGRNVFDDLARSAAQVSVEEVLQRAPDVIVLASTSPSTTTPEKRSGWLSLPALRQGRVIDSLDPALLTRPGPRLVDGVEALARLLHPEWLAGASGADRR